MPNDGQLPPCLWQDPFLPFLLATPGTASLCLPSSLPLQVSPTVGLMLWPSPVYANTALHPRSSPSPTVLLLAHNLPLSLLTLQLLKPVPLSLFLHE